MRREITAKLKANKPKHIGFLTSFHAFYAAIAQHTVSVTILMFTYKVSTEEETMRKTDGGEENWMCGKVLALKVKDGGDGKRINIWEKVRKPPEGEEAVMFFFLQGKIKNSWAPNLEPELWQLHVRSSVFIFSVYHTVEISLSSFPEWVFVPSPNLFLSSHCWSWCLLKFSPHMFSSENQLLCNVIIRWYHFMVRFML